MLELIVAAIGVTILLGFLGNVLFEKTSIPNTLWLLLFGVALGATGFLPREFIFEAAGLISAIAIIGILSDGGLHLDLKTVLTDGFLGVLLMVSGLVFSIGSTIIAMFYFGYSFEIALLVSVILAGTSASVIIPIIVSMKNVSEKLKTILSIESIFDTFSIVIALIIIDFIVKQNFSLGAANGFVQSVFLETFSAIAIGLVFGFFWTPLISQFKKYEFSYAATLGALILVYAFSELLGSSGAIAVFFAGIMLANAYLLFGSIFPHGKFVQLDQDISKTHSLIAFLIRVFFFVFLGMVVGVPSLEFVFIGFVLTILILLGRYLYVNFYCRLKVFDFSIKEKRIAYFMIPRGLSAAVLSVIAFSFNVPRGEEIVEIVFSVIFFSVLVSTLGVFALREKKSAQEKQAPLQEIKIENQLD